VSADTDIAIVGGGPIGAALALALCDKGDSRLRVTVLEARAAREARIASAEWARDLRPIALSHGSRLLLERLGAWQRLMPHSAPTPISNIHVSQRGNFGRVAMSARDADVPALGYVIDYSVVFAALADAAREAHCDYREGARVTAIHRDGDYCRIEYALDGRPATLNARLAVVADGGDIDGLAPAKVIDYGQSALTARVRTMLPHRNTAYERFACEGPLALLPFGEEMALVWTLTPARAQILKDADSIVFLAALRETFGGRLGDFIAVTPRACYPLTLRCATDDAKQGVVTIGNAAQTLHPVAGQGFNLGLRDAWELARVLRTLSVQTIADSESLRRYCVNRRVDRYAVVGATHGLVRLFSNDFFPLNAMRSAGMTLLGSVAPVRDFLARRMIFGVRG